jgi:dihydrolipoamide dehydrogenase
MSSNTENFDVVVIGGGPGGYPAAIRAAQNGAKVALIEKDHLGGTCLNVGCIPTKTLIANAEALKTVRRANEMGIVTGEISFDFAKMKERKDNVIKDLRDGLATLVKSNNISLIRGHARFISPTQIKVTGEDNVLIEAKSTIISTGSYPKELPFLPFDHKKVLCSTSILELTELPKRLIIIGGGVIGCEFASLYNEFDCEVTILEALNDIVPTEAQNISATLRKSFESKGINIHTGVFVEGVEHCEEGIKVIVSGQEAFLADKVLVSVGRSLNTADLGLEKAGVSVTKQGAIETNERMETNVPGIYAIGDITGLWQLAHVASHQGTVAANNCTNTPAQMHYNAVPSVIFTTPEIGTVGMTLEQALNDGHPATLGSFPFAALGKAQAALHTEGFAQVVIHKETGQILGAQVVGHEASGLVAEMAIAIANELTLESVTDTIHAHPTIAEVWLEAAMVANNTPIHLPPKKKRKTTTV